MKDETFGGDLFIPLFLILTKTFFTTWPFVSEKEYMESFLDNFMETSEEVFGRFR